MTANRPLLREYGSMMAVGEAKGLLQAGKGYYLGGVAAGYRGAKGQLPAIRFQPPSRCEFPAASLRYVGTQEHDILGFRLILINSQICCLCQVLPGVFGKSPVKGADRPERGRGAYEGRKLHLIAGGQRLLVAWRAVKRYFPFLGIDGKLCHAGTTKISTGSTGRVAGNEQEKCF